MKPSANIISFVIALGVTTAMVPQAAAAPQQTQPQPEKNTHEKAKGAAAGAANRSRYWWERGQGRHRRSWPQPSRG